MNRKQLAIIAVVLGVAVLLYLPRVFRSDEGTGSVRSGDGFVFRVEDRVTRVDVIVQDAGDTIRIEDATTGWTVDGYRADAEKVDDLLEALPDLSSDEIVARNPANHGQLGVGPESGRRVEVYTDAGGPLVFLLGNRDVAAGGYFVRDPGSDAVFRLEGPVGGYLGRERDAWRPRLIAEVDTAAVREILVTRGEREVVLRRGAEGWSVDGAPADSSAVRELMRILPALSATGFPTDAEAEAADFSAPDASLDVFAEGAGDVTDRRLVLSLRLIEDEEAGDWLARPADDAEVVRLAEYTVRRLVPEDLFP